MVGFPATFDHRRVCWIPGLLASVSNNATVNLRQKEQNEPNYIPIFLVTWNLIFSDPHFFSLRNVAVPRNQVETTMTLGSSSPREDHPPTVFGENDKDRKTL